MKEIMKVLEETRPCAHADKSIRIVRITRTPLMLEKLKTKTAARDDSAKKWGLHA